MQSRRSMLLNLLFAIASTLPCSSETAVVHIQVYDYTGLDSEDAHGASRSAQRLLEEAGVSVAVGVCSPDHQRSCSAGGGFHRCLVVCIISDLPRSTDDLVRVPLSESIADDSGGTYASIFLRRVRDAASDADVPHNTVLAYAMVHEVGHLLLGADAHSLQGIMKATWDSWDFQKMNQNNLKFTRQQVLELERRYGRYSSAPRIEARGADIR